MAAVVSEEDGGTRRFNGWDRVGATFAPKDDEKLSLRNSGAMRQGNISEWLYLGMCPRGAVAIEKVI
jgi:hypothetical protein